MPKEIHYHIADFKVDENNDVKILELGNAFYGSDLSERTRNGFDNKAAMLKHAAQYGCLELTFPEIRSFRHFQSRYDQDDNWELPSYLKEIPAPTNPQKIKFVNDCYIHTIMESIQEKQDAISDQGKNSDLVFDGASGTFYLCDRNKAILNKVLELNDLQHLQPATWLFDLESKEPFVPPSDIPFFIIKPMSESLGKGVMLVARETLPNLLEAIKTGKSYSTNVGDFAYYTNNPQKKLLIQQFCPGKSIHHDGQLYRPTARAVFAVVKDQDQTHVEVLDIFWKLPPVAVQSKEPTASEPVSYSGNSNKRVSQISLEKSEYQTIEKTLNNKLKPLSTALYNYDTKSYLLKLNETKQFDEIRYYLDHYGHVRVRKLDQELVGLMVSVDEKRAMRFLVEQAKYFALPWHLVYKNQFLKHWLQENLAKFESDLLKDLREFFTKSKDVVGDSMRSDKETIIKEANQFIDQINALLAHNEKRQEASLQKFPTKENSSQTFFNDGKVSKTEGTPTFNVILS